MKKSKGRLKVYAICGQHYVWVGRQLCGCGLAPIIDMGFNECGAAVLLDILSHELQHRNLVGDVYRWFEIGAALGNGQSMNPTVSHIRQIEILQSSHIPDKSTACSDFYALSELASHDPHNGNAKILTLSYHAQGSCF